MDEPSSPSTAEKAPPQSGGAATSATPSQAETPTDENDPATPDDTSTLAELAISDTIAAPDEAASSEAQPLPTFTTVEDTATPPDAVSAPEEPPSTTPPPAEQDASTRDSASAPDESPIPMLPIVTQDTSSPEDASGPEEQPKPPTSVVSTVLRRIGTSIGIAGALLIGGGVFLPTSSSGDYEPTVLNQIPLLVVGLLIAPAVILLGINLLAWFRPPPLWLVVFSCLLIILVVWVHWLVEALFSGLLCFDTCPPGGIQYGTGYWLPLIGFPVSGFGIIFAALSALYRRPKRAAKQSRTGSPHQEKEPGHSSLSGPQ